ncbi:hypothetical protein FSP39_006718 [Pinctada imbricata]|uniref:Uncharacterized protein n=1 Tax=Pinctada imbricata TaxID=66713 RepID=A0AA89BYX5_PINIB|nr:hypothetical protein FSP39_006718 [Pinctada imbricata]
MGKYEFGPAKPTDTRTMDRPFSNLSWREKDLANLARKSKSREGCKSGSLIRSRPSSYKSDMIGQSMSRHSSISHLSASEKLMMESDRPRLLSREYTTDRKLKVSPPASEVSSTRRQVTVEIKVDGDETDRGIEELQSRLAEHQIDSFGDEISVTEHIHPTPGPEVKRTQFVESVEKVPLRLFNRYNSAGSSRSSASRQLPDKSRLNSARSYGSSHITGFSYYSKSSVRTNQSKRSVHSPHAITTGNTRSVTVGPNCDLDSLVEKASPRDISKNVHHRSAWYHVPGRYSTPDKPYPPKRSQKTTEARDLEHRLTPTHKYTPGYYITRKPPSSKSRHINHKMTGENRIPHNIHPFGMTVKSIGPVISNGYYSNNPNDYVMNGDLDVEPGNQNTTVKFKEAVVVD